MKKKNWEKPKLVVMVRNRPGEGVLATCKENLDPKFKGPCYPNANRFGCRSGFGNCPACRGVTAPS